MTVASLCVCAYALGSGSAAFIPVVSRRVRYGRCRHVKLGARLRVKRLDAKKFLVRSTAVRMRPEYGSSKRALEFMQTARKFDAELLCPKGEGSTAIQDRFR